jgi:hypothetical protein
MRRKILKGHSFVVSLAFILWNLPIQLYAAGYYTEVNDGEVNGESPNYVEVTEVAPKPKKKDKSDRQNRSETLDKSQNPTEEKDVVVYTPIVEDVAEQSVSFRQLHAPVYCDENPDVVVAKSPRQGFYKSLSQGRVTREQLRAFKFNLTMPFDEHFASREANQKSELLTKRVYKLLGRNKNQATMESASMVHFIENNRALLRGLAMTHGSLYLGKKATGLPYPIHVTAEGKIFIHLQETQGGGAFKTIVNTFDYDRPEERFLTGKMKTMTDGPRANLHNRSMVNEGNQAKKILNRRVTVAGASGMSSNVVGIESVHEYTGSSGEKKMLVTMPEYRGGSLDSYLGQKDSKREPLKKNFKRTLLGFIKGVVELQKPEPGPSGKPGSAHLDLKPGNIFIDVEKTDKQKPIIKKAVLGDLGSMAGKIKEVVAINEDYAPPEYFKKIVPRARDGSLRAYAEEKGNKIDLKKYDVYSSGLILYQMLNNIGEKEINKKMWNLERTPDLTPQQQYQKRIDFFESLPTNTPVEKLMKSMLDPDPKKRISAEEMKRRIESIPQAEFEKHFKSERR